MYGTPEQMAEAMVRRARTISVEEEDVSGFVPAFQVALLALRLGKSDEEAKAAALEYIKEHGGVL